MSNLLNVPENIEELRLFVSLMTNIPEDKLVFLCNIQQFVRLDLNKSREGFNRPIIGEEPVYVLDDFNVDREVIKNHIQNKINSLQKLIKSYETTNSSRL